MAYGWRGRFVEVCIAQRFTAFNGDQLVEAFNQIVGKYYDSAIATNIVLCEKSGELTGISSECVAHRVGTAHRKQNW